MDADAFRTLIKQALTIEGAQPPEARLKLCLLLYDETYAKPGPVWIRRSDLAQLLYGEDNSTTRQTVKRTVERTNGRLDSYFERHPKKPRIKILDDRGSPMALRETGKRLIRGYRLMIEDSEDAELDKHPPEITPPNSPANGITSSSLAQSPVPVFLGTLPSTSPYVTGREKALDELNAAWNDNNTNLYSIVAFGGIGKTSLVNKWLLQMRGHRYRGAERVFGWSFYSQGSALSKQASADEFFIEALRWFGDSNPEEGSPWSKGERLASLIGSRRTLLVLDGLEPLQYPPGKHGLQGQLKDNALRVLLRELARHNQGLCVITTRLSLDDIEEFTGTSAVQAELPELSTEAGEKLLRKLGAVGTKTELRRAARDYGGHALAIALLARFVSLAHNGDIRERDKIRNLTKEPKEGAHARRVILAYERWFQNKPELEILRTLGLFDRPISVGVIDLLRKKPTIRNLTSTLVDLSQNEWHFSIRNLREARLLGSENPADPDLLDCHPLIREHFAEKLRVDYPQAWKRAHHRLYDYYSSVPQKDLPDTLDELGPLFLAIRHGCFAGYYDRTWNEIYLRRIARGDQSYATGHLGAFGAVLEALSAFFREPWSRPVTQLTERNRMRVLGEAARHLRAVGRRHHEVLQAMETALSYHRDQEDWLNSSIQALNLSTIHLTLGHISQAVKRARESVELCERCDDIGLLRRTRGMLGHTLNKAGDTEEAEYQFREAEMLQERMDTKRPILFGIEGYRYGVLLLAKGRYREVITRMKQAAEFVKEGAFVLLEEGLMHILLGRAYLSLATHEERDKLRKYELAQTNFENAVEIIRQSGNQDAIPAALVARAECHRVRLNFDHAMQDLDEAIYIAKRGDMRVDQIDCYLEYARLYVDEGEMVEAKKYLELARRMVMDSGYHRCDGQLAELDIVLS